MSKSVYLSPSTQEKNTGVGSYGTEECRMNQIADVVEKVLKRHGITIYRNEPDWMLSKVIDDSNRKKPDLHFSIHSNAHNGKARGCEVYCHKFGGEGERFARTVYKELSLLTPTEDRGVMEGLNFYGTGKHMYELAYTNAPAALVELSFHDNPDDAKWIMYNIEEIGAVLAKGILKYLGIAYVSETKYDIEKAVEVLKNKGVITSTEYWVLNAVKGKTVKGEYASALIQRVAEVLSK